MPTSTVTVTLTMEDAELDCELLVAYDWQPYERQTYDYPGCDACVDIYSVKSGGVEIYDTLTPQELAMIEDAVWTAREADND